MLFGWVPRDPAAGVDDVVARMARVLRTTPGPRQTGWAEAGLGIGLFDAPAFDGEVRTAPDPAVAGGRYLLWMAGEAFGWPSHGGVSAAESGTLPFRARLLRAFLQRGAAAVADLDGEYQIAIWDRAARQLVLLNDRFGALPIYWLRTAEGVAFAGGVRGVLMAPGARAEPDPDAIREAVSFGGFRLGCRTNVRDVSMVPGASVLTATGAGAGLARYWRWTDIPPRASTSMDEAVEEIRSEWQRAIAARLAGSARPGLTLSGGLDSRAILAEAARHVPVAAVTYGVPESDDVRIARRAAAAAGARWRLHVLYSGANPDWLERREGAIQHTDGLIELTDLMHVEGVDALVGEADLNLSGYIGDAVTGATFAGIASAPEIARLLPFYGGKLGISWEDAVERAARMIADLDGAHPRYALFEHKLPQSTNRVTAALRPYVRVRRPFVDYRLFDLAHGFPVAVRTTGALHERWLRSTYPACFARIPHQRTGVPPLTPPWRRQVTRAVRYTIRRAATRLATLGVPVVPSRRSYHADDVYWRTPDARARIEGTILRPGSISAGIFGRERVRDAVADWFDRLAAPTQVIGALFAFEAYHRDLGRTLREAHAISTDDLAVVMRS
jgi:hypothetical protein